MAIALQPRLLLRPQLLLLLGTVLSACVHTLWLAAPWGGAWREWYADLLSVPVFWLAAATVWSVAARHHEGERRAWRWVALGLLAFGTGTLTWSYLELVAHRQPFPSLADLTFLGMPLAFTLAFLNFPGAPLSKGDAVRTALDALILIGAGGVWTWQKLMAPSFAALAGQPLAQLVATAYPVFDLGLLGLLTLIILRRVAPLPLLLFGLGLLCFATADLSFLLLSALGKYAGGHPVDAIWTWGAVICAAAGVTSGRSPSVPHAGIVKLRPLRPAVLYSALLSCVILAAWITHDNKTSALGVLRGLEALLLLVAARQTLVWHDKERLEEELRDLTGTLEVRVQERTAQVRQTFEGGLLALGVALETRDLETSGHTRRVVTLALALGRALQLSPHELEALAQGAYLHDLGKLAIPDAVLRKPGKLTPEEFALMKTHAAHGHDIAQRLPNLAPGVLDVVLHHHEKWDGGGYPFGLSGADIPLLARIFAVCDVYDALISERPYKRAWTHEAAVTEVEALAGRHFDPWIAHAFAGLDVQALLCGAAPEEGGRMPDTPHLLGEQARHLEEALRYAEAVIDVSRFTTSDLDENKLALEVLRVISGTMPFDWGGLTLIEGGAGRARALWANGAPVTPQHEDVLRREQGVMWAAVQRGESLFVDDYPAEPGAVPEFLRRGVGAVAWMPLLVEASSALVLTVVRRAPAPAWSAHDRRLLEAAGRAVRAALERRTHLRRLEKAAYRDVLTGLGNRRAFEQDVEGLLARGEQALVALLDVDGLKAVNDTFGYARGDELLRALALALRWNLRGEDQVYRLGGDEFTLVLKSGATTVGARTAIETAVASVRGRGFAQVNVSVGYARCPEDGQTVGALLRAADERMYQAKRERVAPPVRVENTSST